MVIEGRGRLHRTQNSCQHKLMCCRGRDVTIYCGGTIIIDVKEDDMAAVALVEMDKRLVEIC